MAQIILSRSFDCCCCSDRDALEIVRGAGGDHLLAFAPTAGWKVRRREREGKVGVPLKQLRLLRVFD